MPQTLKLDILMRAKDEASKHIRTVRMGFERLGKMAAWLKDHWIAVTAAVTGMVYAMKRAIDAAVAQEEAERRLAAAMRAAGVYSTEAMQSAKEYASSLQLVTGYGDEAILTVMGLLRVYGVSEEYIDRVTMLTLNWAAATGKQLPEAALNAARATKGMGEMIERLYPGMTTSIKQTMTMEERLEMLEGRLGKTAYALGVSTVGAMRKLAAYAGDVIEKIGELFTKTEAGREILNRLIGVFVALGEIIEENRDVIIQLIKVALTPLGFALEVIYKVLKPVFIGFVELIKRIGWLIVAFKDGLDEARNFSTGIEELQTDLWAMDDRIREVADRLGDLEIKYGDVGSASVALGQSSSTLASNIEKVSKASEKTHKSMFSLERIMKDYGLTIPDVLTEEEKLIAAGQRLVHGLELGETNIWQFEEGLKAIIHAGGMTGKTYTALEETMKALNRAFEEDRISLEKWDEAITLVRKPMEEIEERFEAWRKRIGEIADKELEDHKRRQLERTEVVMRDEAKMTDFQKKELDKRISALQQHFGFAVSISAKGLSMLIAGEREAGKKMLTMFLQQIGQRLIARGTEWLFEGLAMLLNPLTAARGAALVGIGTAAIAAGAAMGGLAMRITRPAAAGAGAAVGRAEARRVTPAPPEPEARRPREVTIIIQTGQVFATKNEVGRAVAESLNEARRYGVVV